MKQAMTLFVVSSAVIIATRYVYGYDMAYSIAYGAVVAMAASISATFFWLWYVRQTPLALGMGFSWAGTTGVLGWWWVYQLLSEPRIMTDSAGLFLFVAAYFVGAILHFRVVGRALGWRSMILLAPLMAAIWLAAIRIAA